MRRHPRPPMGHPGMGPIGMGPIGMGPIRPLRTPLHHMGHRGPVPAMGHRGPVPAMGHRGLVPAMGHRGPVPAMGHRGPVPAMGHRGPVPVMGMPHRPSMGPPPPGMLSSCTNSNDPASMDSRIFVGNLNTVALSKEAIEEIFVHYGCIMGISMHKGYAFVQFNNPDEARRAGASEDGKHYAGQAIDINIVSQPKSRNALKRPTVARPVNDAPPKKPRNDSTGTNQSLQRTLVTLSGNAESTKKVAATNAVKRAIATVSKKLVTRQGTLTRPVSTVAKTSLANKPAGTRTTWPDVLICGICKLQFTSLHSLAQHKKIPCGLRVSTQAKNEVNSLIGDNDEPNLLICASCDAQFNKAWALCQHCTDEHKMSIFKTESGSTTENQNATEKTHKA